MGAGFRLGPWSAKFLRLVILYGPCSAAGRSVSGLGFLQGSAYMV